MTFRSIILLPTIALLGCSEEQQVSRNPAQVFRNELRVIAPVEEGWQTFEGISLAEAEELRKAASQVCGWPVHHPVVHDLPPPTAAIRKILSTSATYLKARRRIHATGFHADWIAAVSYDERKTIYFLISPATNEIDIEFEGDLLSFDLTLETSQTLQWEFEQLAGQVSLTRLAGRETAPNPKQR